MMMSRLAMIVAAAIMATSIGGAARSATLDGRSFVVDYLFPDSGTVYPSTDGPVAGIVGAGVDAVITVEGVTAISLDFSDNVLAVLLNTTLMTPTWNNVAFNGLRISFQNTSIAAFNLVDSDFGPIAPSFSGGDLFINWPGASYVDGSSATFAISPVPVPSALPLLASALAGFAGAGLARKRRRSAT